MLDLLLIFAGMFILILLNDWYYKWKEARACKKHPVVIPDSADEDSEEVCAPAVSPAD